MEERDNRENPKRKRTWRFWEGVPGGPLTAGGSHHFSPDIHMTENKRASISTKVKQQQHNSVQHFRHPFLFGQMYGNDLRGLKSALRV